MATQQTGRQTTETQLREQVRDLARLYGWRFWFCWTSIHSPRGLPDLILARPPRLIFAELKSEKGMVSLEQQGWLDTLGACPGCEAYLWRPADLEEITEVLR